MQGHRRRCFPIGPGSPLSFSVAGGDQEGGVRGAEVGGYGLFIDSADNDAPHSDTGRTRAAAGRGWNRGRVAGRAPKRSNAPQWDWRVEK